MTTTLLTAGDVILTADDSPLAVGFGLVEPFDTLGARWVNGHDISESFAPLGVDGAGSLCCADPFDNNNGGAGSPPYNGIGVIHTETNTTEIELEVVMPPLEGHRGEVSCLFHVVEDHPWYGIGAWLSSFVGAPTSFGIVYLSYVANPVLNFGIGMPFAIGFYDRLEVDQVARWRSVDGLLTLEVDGTPVEITQDFGSGLEPVPGFEVHPDLADSTTHGIALDLHLELDEPSPDGERAMVRTAWLSSIAS